MAWQGKEAGQDEKADIWNVLWLGLLAVRSAKEQSKVSYTLRLEQATGVIARAALQLCIGPGDEVRPSITIMLVDED